ncbi:MAG: hypothetical protein KF773_19255 [Deltaproteobacteria bacterium]|nr:hypothetical protein [Deltaproteobacteria bacterium]
MTCRSCKRERFDVSAAEQMCGACVKKLGVTPLPPPRRRAVPCRHCSGLQFARVVPRGFALTYTFDPATEAFAGPTVRPQPEQLRGILEAYVCRACGAVEWFCNDAERIPIGPEYNSDLVDYAGTEPYR